MIEPGGSVMLPMVPQNQSLGPSIVIFVATDDPICGAIDGPLATDGALYQTILDCPFLASD